MEWNFKKPFTPWEAVSNIGLQESSYHQHLAALAGGTTRDNNNGIASNNMFSIDLKLGRLGDTTREVVAMDASRKGSGALTMAPPSFSSSPSPRGSGSSRKGRARGGGAQAAASCSVDGCTSDLCQCREYHRRHRVCERHSKTPVVLIGGREQRFCQQCSRFHSLGEFDGAKRSCRKRLEGHNRRRRKTQPGTVYMASGGTQSSQRGNGTLQFWSNSDNRPVPAQAAKALDSLSWSTNTYKVHDQTPLIPHSFHQTIFQPQLNDTAPLGNNSRGIQRAPPNTASQPPPSECALSLLSRHIPMPSSAQGLGSSLNSSNDFAHFPSSQGVGDECSASLTTTGSNVQLFAGFHQGHDGFSENGSSRIFPFGW